jgi:hypothetical protein
MMLEVGEVHPSQEMEFGYEEMTEYLTMKEKIVHCYCYRHIIKKSRPNTFLTELFIDLPQ